MTKDSLTRSVAVFGVAAALFAAGCSTTTTSSPGAPTTKTKSSAPSTSKSTSSLPCDQVKKLRSSLTDLTKTGINPTSASKLTKTLKDIQADLAALKGKATGKLKTQLDQLKMTITKISTDAKGLTSDPAGTITKLTTDLSKLKSTAGPVIAEINAACPK
ncbi:MAG TPA: hypothetical protein VFI65_20050 [Streptosporangiaceae bacterium]|nr:hypothetical protein [Streptosporangiaceae bacterium]